MALVYRVLVMDFNTLAGVVVNLLTKSHRHLVGVNLFHVPSLPALSAQHIEPVSAARWRENFPQPPRERETYGGMDGMEKERPSFMKRVPFQITLTEELNDERGTDQRRAAKCFITRRDPDLPALFAS